MLLIFTKERSATKFKREITVEGSSNELYAQNMEYRHHYDEIIKHFGEGRRSKKIDSLLPAE